MQMANTKHVAAVSDETTVMDFGTSKVDAPCMTPIMVTVDIKGQDLDMEIDTGAAYSMISQSSFKAKFADLKLQKSWVLLKIHTND